MLKIKYDPNNYDEKRMYQNMSGVCLEIADAQEKFRDCSLQEYTAYLWSEVPESGTKIAENARKHLYSVMEQELHNQLNPREAQEALAEFKMRPVVQTGPHCQLLLDKCNFYSAVFSLCGLKSVGHKYYFLYNCSTSTLEVKTKFGPGWVKFHDTDINVFGLPRQVMAKSSVNAIERPLEFQLKYTLGSKRQNAVEQCISEVKSLLEAVKSHNAPQAFNAANRILWHSWDKQNKYCPVFLDETFFSKLLLAHLSDEDSFIYKILNSFSLRQKILQVIENEASGVTGSMIPKQTEFFWAVRNNRIHPLTIQNGRIAERVGSDGINLPYTIENLKTALEQGIIIPNLFVIFAMFSILGNARVVGGLHQIAYYPAFQRVLLSVLDDRERDEKKLHDFLLYNRNHAWGTHVLEEPDDVSDLLKEAEDGKQLEQLMERYSGMSLWEATRGMEILRKYWRWGPILCNI